MAFLTKLLYSVKYKTKNLSKTSIFSFKLYKLLIHSIIFRIYLLYFFYIIRLIIILSIFIDHFILDI